MIDFINYIPEYLKILRRRWLPWRVRAIFRRPFLRLLHLRSFLFEKIRKNNKKNEILPVIVFEFQNWMKKRQTKKFSPVRSLLESFARATFPAHACDYLNFSFDSKFWSATKVKNLFFLIKSQFSFLGNACQEPMALLRKQKNLWLIFLNSEN